MNQNTKAPGPAVVSFQATACADTELLRSPVSGLPCVHWRLRIVEHITARMQLVHEMASPTVFTLSWAGSAGADSARPPLRVRVDPEAARIHAAPVLHREGTPGALAAAHQFGMTGPLCVEEVMIRDGEVVEAHGILEDPAGADGPFRSNGRGLELIDATVRIPTRSIGPALLPWALGTAAALLGTTAAAGYGAWRHHLLHLPTGRNVRVIPSDAMVLPAEVRPPEPLRPRLP
jgi:hypothetical protein